MRLHLTINSLVLFGAALQTPALAQFPPEKFENLKVLPEDIPTRELINTMRGIAIGLGVRCTYCHVGEEGRPLSEYDFPSDEKPTKEKAREMLKMVKAINAEFLANLPERKEPNVSVSCETCHRGQARPIFLQDALVQVVETKGLDSAIARYRSLRERYYGSATFDFSERVLPDAATRLARRRNLDAAKAFLELNLEFYPESGRTYFAMGELHFALQEKEQAITAYEKSLEFLPNNPRARRRLQQLKGG